MEYPSNIEFEIRLWHFVLIIITIINVVAWFYSYSKTQKKSFNGSKYSIILAGIYVVACGLRSILPRHDGKSCLFDSMLSTTLIGRTFATFGELSFMAQLCIYFHQLSTDLQFYEKQNVDSFNFIRTFSKLSFGINILAQTFCWLGVTTLNQIWHVFEESIWGLTLFGMVLCSNFLYKKILKIKRSEFTPSNPNIKITRNFLWYFRIFASIYVFYMFFIDVPMYFKRWKLDSERGMKYNTVIEGFSEASYCKVITGDYSSWADEIIWMTGYFSFGVWTSIWLAQSPRIIPNPEKKE